MTNRELLRRYLFSQGLVPKNFLRTLQAGNPDNAVRNPDGSYVNLMAPVTVVGQRTTKPFIQGSFITGAEQNMLAANSSFYMKERQKMQADLNNQDSWDLYQRAPVDINPHIFAPVQAGASALGGLASQMSTIGRPDPGLGALGGVLQGASAGAAFGPMGLLLGGAIGGLSGAARVGMAQNMYDENAMSKEKEKIKASTVYGDLGTYQAGGETEEGGLEPVQTSIGEVLAYPTGYIYDTKSKKQHYQMTNQTITDLLPPNVFVATHDKNSKITPAQAKLIKIGVEPLEYSEGFNTSDYKEVDLSSVFGKKKLTPAEILKKVRNKYPTNDRPNDPYARQANEGNLKSRMPYIQAVIEVNKQFINNGILHGTN